MDSTGTAWLDQEVLQDCGRMHHKPAHSLIHVTGLLAPLFLFRQETWPPGHNSRLEAAGFVKSKRYKQFLNITGLTCNNSHRTHEKFKIKHIIHVLICLLLYTAQCTVPKC